MYLFDQLFQITLETTRPIRTAEILSRCKLRGVLFEREVAFTRKRNVEIGPEAMLENGRERTMPLQFRLPAISQGRNL